jgi:hypothetical protein
MEAAFRLQYCKANLAAANLLAVRQQEISHPAKHESEVTVGPMIEGDTSLDTGNHAVEPEDMGPVGEVNAGFTQGSFPINIIV